MPTTVVLPEGELRVARCDTLDKLIAVGDGDAALLYLYVLRHGGAADGKAAARALGEKSLVMMHVRDLVSVTGYMRGGCSPVGM